MIDEVGKKRVGWCFGREGRDVEEWDFWFLLCRWGSSSEINTEWVLQARRKGHDSSFICLFIQKVPQISLVSSSG